MHELSVTESLLEIATKHAVQVNATKVTALNIVIGRLSSIVDDSVQFYWDFVSENTICQGSKLYFSRKPALLQCQTCRNEFEISKEMTPCPDCGSYNTCILSGEEFFLDSIEIEKGSEQVK